MAEAIFLSAGVPDQRRGPDFAATADTVAIAAAVSAVVYVTLGRRILVWGGHPSITPMIWAVARDVGVDYGKWVRLYQSRHFRDEFPEDNERFNNVSYTEDVRNDRELSLLAMRERMFADHQFSAAVFIGGMGGIIQEFELFQSMHPEATVIPVVSTGGAVLSVGEKLPNVESDLLEDLDYVALFHRHLQISPREGRFVDPEDQPALMEERYWRPPPTK